MSSGSYVYGGGVNDDYRRSKSWSGSNDPKHRAENPYTCVFSTMSRGKSNCYCVETGVLEGLPSFQIVGLNMYPPAPGANMELSVLSKLSSALRGHDFNAAVFAAEGKESVQTILSTSFAIREMFRGLFTGNIGLVFRSIRGVPGQIERSALSKRLKAGDISGAVLAIRYGWQPLLQDCFEAAKALEAVTRNPRTVTYRASVSETSETMSTALVKCRMRSEIRYKVILKERIGQARSLGLLNPATVIWEKTPFSFVWDWFMPIGSYLESLGTFTGMEFSSVTRTTFRIGVEEGLKPPAGYTMYPKHYVYVGGFWKSTTGRVDRTVSTSINVPRPNFKSLDRALSITHMQNAAALVHGNVKAMRDFSDGYDFKTWSSRWRGSRLSA